MGSFKRSRSTCQYTNTILIMLTSYNLSVKNFRLDGLNVDADNAFGVNHNQETISIGSSLSVYGKQSFQDPMDIGWEGFSGVNTSRAEKLYIAFNTIGSYTDGLSTSVYPSRETVGIGTTYGRLGWNRKDLDNLGYDNIRKWRDHISKAMIVALLDGNGKRTTSIGSSTLQEKVETFFNILQDNDPKNRHPDINLSAVNYGAKPWDTWYDSHSILTISSVSRSNNIATVTTSSAHGLSNSYDDWGAVITLNSSSTQSYSINVINNGSGAYTLSGNDRNGSVSGDNDTVNINVGDTITFNVNASGHPFWIKTSAVTGTGYAASGVINNGSQNGSVSWTPSSAGTYYYICQYHGSMNGIISVSSSDQSGISSSFNISTSRYPNGVPIKITGLNTFHYKSIGFNTTTTAINGTADIRVGFGGTSNDLHFYIT